MTLTRIVVGIAVFLAAVQLIRPARTNSPVDPARTIDAALSVDPAVASVFERSCKDCHSNRTTWPWYSSVAPVSWLVIHDVNEGRGKLNLSEWRSYDSAEAQTVLKRICREVSGDDMPIFAYKIIHRDAVLSEADKQTICSWTQRLAP